MQSREALVNRALRELGVIGSGQQASAEDYAIVNQDVEPVMADLAKRNVWQWGDLDQIPDEALIHLAIILAGSAAAQFGIAADDIRRIYAEARLKELRTVPDAGDPIRAEYF